MSDNILERAIVPYNPSSNRVVNNNQYNLYAPAAGVGKVGMAGYSQTDFDVSNSQTVSISNTFKGSVLQQVKIDDIPSNITYEGTDGIKTTGVMYNGYTREVVDVMMADNVPVYITVTGALLVASSDFTDTDNYSVTEMFIADGRTWTRELDIIDGEVDEVTDFMPLGVAGEQGPVGPQGEKGDTGNGIQTIVLTSTIGRAKTYTITYTDDTTTTFTVLDGKSFHIAKTYANIAEMNADYNNPLVEVGDFVLIASGINDPDNAKMYVKGASAYEYVTDLSGATGIQGVGISSVTKTGTSGLVDTYTITYTDGSTSTFQLHNGRGITTIAKTSTSGLVDTYTITLTDNTTSSFTVTNGQSGTGAGNVIATNVSVANVVYAYRGATIDDNGNITGQLVTLAEGGIQTVLTFDSTPTDGSSNPVTSNGIKVALDAKQNTLTFDSTPTAGSTNAVSSGGVKTALDGKQNTLSFDTAPTEGSNNPVTSNGVFDALDGKQNTLSFDTAPTDGSNNPVTSNGVYDGLSTKQAKNLNFTDTVIAINGFVADATYADFPFRATVPLTGVTASMVASVVLSLADATSGKFAPVCDTYAGGVYLYSTETNAVAITIPTIIVEVV